jgi:quinol monooxygenase YgiN
VGVPLDRFEHHAGGGARSPVCGDRDCCLELRRVISDRHECNVVADVATMSEPIIAVGHVFGVAARAAELPELLRSHQERVEALPGCRLCHFGSSLDDPDDYVVTQEWESVEALRGYVRSDALYDFRRRMLDMMTRPWQLTLHFVRESVALEEYAPMDPRRAD